MRKFLLFGLCFTFVFSMYCSAQLGGFQKQDPKSPKMLEKAKKVVTLFLKENNMFINKAQKVRFIKLHKASTQVVAGIKYLFVMEFKTQTMIEMWQIKAYESLSGTMAITKTLRIKVSKIKDKKKIVGAFTKQNSNDKKMIAKAKKVAVIFLKEYKKLKFFKLRSVATQVVAGINYSFLIEFVSTAHREIWKIIAYEDLRGNMKIMKKTLVKKVRKMMIPGGYVKQSLTSVDIQRVAKKVANLFITQHSEFTFVKAHKAGTQAVAGINYFFVLEFESVKGRTFWNITAYENFDKKIAITKKEQVK